MSLEAIIDEENKQVLAALDRKRPSSPLPKSKHSRTATPPPVRSMLDIDAPVPRHGSIAGIGVGVTSPGHSRKSISLDPADPTTYTSPNATKQNSPVLSKSQPASTRQRTSSESDRPVGLPKIQLDEKRGFEQSYQFDIASIPSSAGPARSTTEHKRPREGSGSAMVAAMSGDFSSLYVGVPGGGAGRHNSAPTAGSNSRSPSSRTRKPDTSKSGLLNPASPPKPLTTNSGTVVDDQAHRRLSNKSSSFSTSVDESGEERGIGRVHEDGGGEEDAVAESSEEDGMPPSSDEDETRGRPGRRKYSSEKGAKPKGPEEVLASEVLSPEVLTPEEEKKPLPTTQSVKSLLEPSISITSPSGESVPEAKPQVQPETHSGAPSVASGDEDDEEMAAIKKAKTLALNISPLDSSVADRNVRIVLRGNWVHFHEEAEAGRRTARIYLVCSDLSVEASYAMEWVVGTMLKDGDTLLAIYAMEDENAGKATEAEREVLQAEGVKAGKDASEVMATLTRQTTQGGGTSFGLGSGKKYIPATEVESLTGSVDARKVSKKEMERLRAVEDITQNFIKLVRKTTLQVRCMVEVIHCNSPKHLILGAVSRIFLRNIGPILMSCTDR